MTKHKLEEFKVKIKLEKTKAEAQERITHAYSKLAIIVGAIAILIVFFLQR